jgi:Zn finger protein HypA/HybF involved in hydrogenase expression
MHEASLVMALFDQTDEAVGIHDPRSVRQVQVCVGHRAGVEADLFALAFEGLRQDRGYENAELQLRQVAGRDIILERIELEVEDV